MIDGNILSQEGAAKLVDVLAEEGLYATIKFLGFFAQREIADLEDADSVHRLLVLIANRLIRGEPIRLKRQANGNLVILKLEGE